MVLRGPAELWGRFVQWEAAALERLGYLSTGHVDPRSVLLPTLPFPRLGRDEAHRAFARDTDALTHLTDCVGQLHAGRFDLLGLRGLHFGHPPDWHLDPVHGRRAPIVHWSRVRYLDQGEVGDHKVIWELNRHQFLVTLAQAWALTGDPRHPALAATLVENWLEQNPPKQGINWASSLELAFRAIAWTWALHLFGNEIPIGLRARMACSLDLHGRHIERYLSTWFSPNTHLTGEALGLLYLGTAWPGLQRAARWRRLGWRILVEQLPRQVRTDGTYFEQSSWYQGYTVDFYLHALRLAEGAGLPVPTGLRDRIRAAAQVLAALVRADGTIPLIGDDDGGRLLPLGRRPPTCFADTLAHAAAVLDAPELTQAVKVPPHAAWLVGDLPTKPAGPPLAGSTAFRAGGWFVARTGRESRRVHLFIDGGPHGALAGAHAHADALSIDLALGTGPLFSDPGTRSYVGQDRNLFRSTAWHSTVAIPGLSSAEPGGPFRWKTFPTTAVLAWETGPGFAWFDGWHDGWSRLAPGLRHRRSILCLEGLGIIVLDCLTGAVSRELPEPEIRWHCATGVTAASAGLTVCLSRDGKRIAGLASGTPSRVVVEAGRSSTCYGSEQESVFIVCRPGRKALATGVATAILVGDDAGACLASASADGRGSWTLLADGTEASIEQTAKGIRWSVDRGMRPGLPAGLDLVTAEPW